MNYLKSAKIVPIYWYLTIMILLKNAVKELLCLIKGFYITLMLWHQHSSIT